MSPHPRRPADERIELGLFADEGPPPAPPWDDPATRAEFARSQRETRKRLIGWSVAGAGWLLLAVAARPWLGSSSLYWFLDVWLFIGFLYAIFRAMAAHALCPFCGENFAGRVDLADEDVSGSWNHCASCKVRLR